MKFKVTNDQIIVMQMMDEGAEQLPTMFHGDFKDCYITSLTIRVYNKRGTIINANDPSQMRELMDRSGIVAGLGMMEDE